jgi:hypothetical protein
MVNFEQRRNDDGNDFVLLPLNEIIKGLKIGLGANVACVILV